MSTGVVSEVCPPLPAAPERSFLNRVRTAAGVAVRAVATLPELNAMSADPFTLADGVVYKDKTPKDDKKVTEVPAVPAEKIRAELELDDRTVHPHGGTSFNGTGQGQTYKTPSDPNATPSN